MKFNLFLSAACSLLLTLWSPSASGADTPPAKAKKPVEISEFMQTAPQGGFFFKSSTGALTPAKLFKVGFKISDPSLTALDTAKIYFYNNKKEPLDTLSRIESLGPKILAVPNILTDLQHVKPGPVYHIIFSYMQDRAFQYALLVLGTKDAVVVRCIPQSENPDNFQFDEKPLVVK